MVAGSLYRDSYEDARGRLSVCECTKEKRGGKGMSWEYFILFAVVALVCWSLGAFAAWKEMCIRDRP